METDLCFRESLRILDAGCGSGRNLVYFLREGYEVYAVDPDVQAVENVRALARMFAPALPKSNFSIEAVEHMSFDDAYADVVICNTVLHFGLSRVHGALPLLQLPRSHPVTSYRQSCDENEAPFTSSIPSVRASMSIRTVRLWESRQRA